MTQYFFKYATATGYATTPDVLAMDVEFDVNAYDVAHITLPASTPGILQFKKCWILRSDGLSDTVIFSGFVYQTTGAVNVVNLTLRSEKAILQKKLVVADVTYTATAANAVLAALLTQWNTPYSETYSASSTVTTSVTKAFKKGDDLYAAIDELAGLVGCVWRVDAWVVRMATFLGTDRSVSGSGYAEVAYDSLDPVGTNVSEMKVETYSTISNVLISSDGTTKRTDTDATSISSFGPLGEYKEFRVGSLATQAAAYLASKKTEQKVISVTVSNALPNVSAGDKVRLSIRNAGEYLNFDWSAIVNKKKLAIENGTETNTLELADSYAYIDTLSKTLAQISAQAYFNSL